MMIDFFIFGMAIAGFAVVWRNFLEQTPAVKRVLLAVPFSAGRAFTCGSCFTYWLALVVTSVFIPFDGWVPAPRIEISATVLRCSEFFFTWMSLSWFAVTLRFGYVLIQENVNRLMHGGDDPRTHIH